VVVLWLNAASPEESLKFVSDTGATLPVLSFAPEANVMDDYRVRVTPFMFLLDEKGAVRAKGLANTKSGLDLYYKELKPGKQGPTEDQQQEQAVVQQAHSRN
jgi:hypothetical protein